MDVTLAVLADAANLSREGKLNILGSFSNLNAREFPAVHPEMTLVLRLEASPAETGQQKKIEMMLLDADGKKSDGAGFAADFTVPPPSRRGKKILVHSIVRMVGLRFERPGDYQIAILVNGETKTDIPLSVTLLQPDEGDNDDAGA